MLTSVRNPAVASALHLRKRAYRERERRFLLEGAQTVGEALEAGRLEALFTADDLAPLAVAARQAGVATHHVSDQIVRRLTSTVTPQPLVGVAGFVDVTLDDVVATEPSREPSGDGGLVTILHEVRDPGNAGTIVRSADAAGASGVVFSTTSVDPYNPKAVRASAGSIFHVPIVRSCETTAAIDAARAGGARVLAMTAGGTEDLFRTDLSGPIAMVFGNEAAGLPSDVIVRADATVRVPQAGDAESLNLAAAATVCVFEWRRRRLHAGDALDTIVGAAAHDIRSPLTAMKGFGYALERRWAEMTEEQRALMLRGIVYDADRMDTILRQLVDAARVVSGTLEVFKEQVQVGELVEAVARTQRRDPDHPEVVWAGGELVAFVDPARLKTAVLTFCESLVWWGSEGPIRIDGSLDASRVLHLAAGRTAPPLGDAEIEALFTPRRPGEGAGSKVGLFVVRGVAEAQGGRCWGSAGPRGTLTFHLELPAGPDDAAIA